MPVTTNLDQLIQFRKTIENDLQRINTKTGHIAKAFKEWNFIFWEFQSKRFDRLSGGSSGRGGRWRRLKKSTLKARRSKGNFNTNILVVTGTLRKALQPKTNKGPGQINKRVSGGVLVGLGGPQRHPGSPSLTIGQLGFIHQFGTKNIPARTVVVAPTATVIKKMNKRIDVAISKIAEEANK